jgi:hypothetical protein
MTLDGSDARFLHCEELHKCHIETNGSNLDETRLAGQQNKKGFRNE